MPLGSDRCTSSLDEGKAEKELNSRSAYTAIARVKPGDPSAFQLEVGRDF